MNIYIHRILKYIEKYAQTDMTYIAKGGFWLSVAQVISSGTSLLLTLAFASLVSKDTYGTYKYVFSLFALLSIPTLSGMGTAITQSVARGFEGSVIPGFKEKVKWGVLGSIASIVLSIYYYINANTSFALIFFVISFFIPFINSFFLYTSYLGGKKLFKKVTEYGVFTQITGTIVMVAILYIFKNIFAIIFGYLVVFTLLNGFFFYLTLKKYPPNNQVEKESVSLGRHLSYIDIIVTAIGQLDKILLFHFIGAEALAIYSFAMAPVAQLRGLFKSTIPLAMPKIAANNVETLKKTLPQKIIIMTAGLVVPVIAYIILIPYFYNIFFPAYADAIIYSQYYIFTLIFIPKNLFAITLNTHADKKTLYSLSIITSIVSSIIQFILLPLYGIAGAIASELIVQCIDTGLSIYYFKKLK